MIARDKLTIFFLELMLLLILFFALFVPNIFTRIVLAILLFIYMIAILIILKKRKILSIYSKQVTYLMFALGLVYVISFYMMGIYFGFYESTVKLSFWSLFHYIIPYIIIIVSSEVIRYIFLSQKIKITKILTFISMVLIDLVLYINVYNITSLEKLLTVIGYILFASISCNLLYNYIANRFGYKPVIFYRLITVLYCYIVPVIPDVYIFFKSVLRMLYPYLIYLLLEYTYSKKDKIISYVDKKTRIINTSILFTFVIAITMLVSCQFKYGVLVVGSGSMSGTLNKGDVIVFESYTKQSIAKDDIIIFEKDDLSVIHRVKKIRFVNGENHYYTKGDANEKMDEGYTTNKQIKGISKFKISYIGYPAIWLRDMFK